MVVAEKKIRSRNAKSKLVAFQCSMLHDICLQKAHALEQTTRQKIRLHMKSIYLRREEGVSRVRTQNLLKSTRYHDTMDNVTD